MKPIDFDSRFQAYLQSWLEQNSELYSRPDEMEEMAPEVYIRFLNAPADWLGGVAPSVYFDKEDSSEKLLQTLVSYIKECVPVPDPLFDRLAVLADDQAVLSMVTDKNAPVEARMHGIELLRELESDAPLVDYIRWQVERNEDDELLDNALDSLRQMGEKAKRPAKIAFTAADTEGKEALLEVLCDYQGDDDVLFFAIDQFLQNKDKRALYASYLAKLDDDRALEALLDVAEGDDVSYIDFIEIRSAIERLGSEAPIRDFSNDPTYRAVKRMQ